MRTPLGALEGTQRYRKGLGLNLAQTRGDKFIRFFFSLLSLLYLTCGSARIVVLTLEKQHVFDRADPIMPPLCHAPNATATAFLLLTICES